MRTIVQIYTSKKNYSNFFIENVLLALRFLEIPYVAEFFSLNQQFRIKKVQIAEKGLEKN